MERNDKTYSTLSVSGGPAFDRAAVANVTVETAVTG
jgi:hypothetical protein